MQEEHTARRALREVMRIKASGVEEGVVVSVNSCVMKEVKRLSLGGIYLKTDDQKGPNDYHVSVEMRDVTRNLEYLA